MKHLRLALPAMLLMGALAAAPQAPVLADASPQGNCVAQGTSVDKGNVRYDMVFVHYFASDVFGVSPGTIIAAFATQGYYVDPTTGIYLSPCTPPPTSP
jgi:hypothetical protein